MEVHGESRTKIRNMYHEDYRKEAPSAPLKESLAAKVDAIQKEWTRIAFEIEL